MRVQRNSAGGNAHAAYTPRIPVHSTEAFYPRKVLHAGFAAAQDDSPRICTTPTSGRSAASVEMNDQQIAPRGVSDAAHSG
jgi:hypothetical protein